MATASAKKVILARRTIPDSSKTAIADSGEIVEQTKGEQIELTKTSETEYEEQVTVVVPNSFTLTRDDGSVKHYSIGTQEMPETDATHWFSRAQGVKVYVP